MKDIEKGLDKRRVSLGQKTIYKSIKSLWKEDPEIHCKAFIDKQSETIFLGLNAGRPWFKFKYYYDSFAKTPKKFELEREKEKFFKLGEQKNREYMSMNNKEKKKYATKLLETVKKERGTRKVNYELIPQVGRELRESKRYKIRKNINVKTI